MAKAKATKKAETAAPANKAAAKVWKRRFWINPTIQFVQIGDEVTESHRVAWLGATKVPIDNYIE